MLEEHTQSNRFDLETAKPGGFWIRVLAYFIDMLVLLVFIVGSLFMRSVPGYLLVLAPMILYKPVLEGLLGGTAGKLALGLRVVNREGGLLGLAGGLVRSGIFILPAIPNALLQVKMIQQGISPLDTAAVQAFQQANSLLYMASYALTALAGVSCLVVAFNKRKRGWHDLIADSQVIYKDRRISD